MPGWKLCLLHRYSCLCDLLFESKVAGSSFSEVFQKGLPNVWLNKNRIIGWLRWRLLLPWPSQKHSCCVSSRKVKPWQKEMKQNKPRRVKTTWNTWKTTIKPPKHGLLSVRLFLHFIPSHIGHHPGCIEGATSENQRSNDLEQKNKTQTARLKHFYQVNI